MFGIERLWSAVAQTSPPFTVQLVVEGSPEDGQLPIDRPTLQRAVGEAAAVHPGVRLRREGRLKWSRWRAFGAAPPVREVDGHRWSGRDEKGAPFLQLPLVPGGATVEVLLVRGACDRLVFRGHHAVVDGRGLLYFAEDVFAVLRGESPRGASLDVSDLELARSLGGKKRGIDKMEWGMPTGVAGAVPRGTPMPWRRVRFEGSTHRLLPRLGLAIYHASRAYTQEPLMYEIPVDLRRHLPEGVRTTANITGGARIEMALVMEAADPLEAFVDTLQSRASHPDASAPILDSQKYRWLPKRTLIRILEGVRAKSLETGKVGTSAILSNLGRYSLARLSCPRHAASAWFWVPSGGPVVPLFILATGDGRGVELSIGMSPELATDGRLDGLIDGIVHHLSVTGEQSP